MPSLTQIKELFDSGNTTSKWTTQNGINGFLITSKKNGKTLFLPAAGSRAGEGALDKPGERGEYWSRSLLSLENGSTSASDIQFFDSYFSIEGSNSRVTGGSVRPVRTQK